MTKIFNYTGICNASKHYMVDISDKLKKITQSIENEEYFTITLPRQYGKTTTLDLLEKMLLKNSYYVVSINFEGIGNAIVNNEETFSKYFVDLIADASVYYHKDITEYLRNNKKHINNLKDVSKIITAILKKLKKKSVLIIDEIDAAGNNQLIVDFLGMLRDKYIKQSKNRDATFESVILTGVHDVTNMPLPIRSGDLNRDIEDYNTVKYRAWNIVSEFTIDFCFSPDEIATMLTDYVNDKNITMEVPVIAEKIHYYTSGHPFLTSRLCYIIDTRIMRNDKWTVLDVEQGTALLLKDANTHFESIIHILDTKTALSELAERILVNGARIDYSDDNALIHFGKTYGLFKNEGRVKIQNRIYEQRIYNYLTLNLHLQALLNTRIELYNYPGNFINADKSLDFKKVLIKFQQFIKEQYTEEDLPFLEKNSRLIFLSFIKPMLNGRGLDFKEIQQSEEKQLDIIITYHNTKYIIELKAWRGEKAHENGTKLFADYLEKQGQTTGYLVIFDFSQNKQWKQNKIKSTNKEIFAVYV